MIFAKGASLLKLTRLLQFFQETSQQSQQEQNDEADTEMDHQNSNSSNTLGGFARPIESGDNVEKQKGKISNLIVSIVEFWNQTRSEIKTKIELNYMIAYFSNTFSSKK